MRSKRLRSNKSSTKKGYKKGDDKKGNKNQKIVRGTFSLDLFLNSSNGNS